MLVSAEGTWMLEDSTEFRAALGDPEPDYDGAAFAVKNLGFIRFQILDNSIIEIDLHPRNVEIPALIIEDGTVLYDSPVILEYLDTRAGGGRIIPKDPQVRIAALTLQALCDGILDAGILLVYEGRWRPEDKHVAKWVEHQAGKVARGLASLEAAPPSLDSPPNVGQIALACALGYRDWPN